MQNKKIAALQIENTNFIDIPLEELPDICIGKDQQRPLVVFCGCKLFYTAKRVKNILLSRTKLIDTDITRTLPRGVWRILPFDQFPD